MLKLTSARIATQIKGRSIEEIRSFFKISNDFTPEQELNAREENEFARHYF